MGDSSADNNEVQIVTVAYVNSAFFLFFGSETCESVKIIAQH